MSHFDPISIHAKHGVNVKFYIECSICKHKEKIKDFLNIQPIQPMPLSTFEHFIKAELNKISTQYINIGWVSNGGYDKLVCPSCKEKEK